VDGGGRIGPAWNIARRRLVSDSGLKLDKDDSDEDQTSGKQQVNREAADHGLAATGFSLAR
jgi:hypothetical protein